jgi:hypothetical protein
MSVRENMDMLPKDRATALAIGALHFYSGIPCGRGHLSKRTASRNTCLECNMVASRKYKNTEKAAAVYATRVKRLKESGEWARKNASRVLKHEYGITLVEYEMLLAKQNGVCAICQQPEKTLDKKNNSLRRLAVDHCHTTSKIRGLLCFYCNTGIGKFGDNPQLIERAAEYVRSEGEFN